LVRPPFAVPAASAAELYLSFLGNSNHVNSDNSSRFRILQINAAAQRLPYRRASRVAFFRPHPHPDPFFSIKIRRDFWWLDAGLGVFQMFQRSALRRHYYHGIATG